MSSQARRAVVTALCELAAGPNYRDRADAGRALASFTDVPEATEPSLDLVLDADDTPVTYATVEALLRRHDAAGLAVVAAALNAADQSQIDWIGDAVIDVFGVSSRDRDTALRQCRELADSPHERVRCGVENLSDMLAEIEPVLRPYAD